MFKKNVGNTDRAIRAVVGIVLLGLAFASLTGTLAWVAGIIGVVMLGTAALGTCPPYALLGINTCKLKS
ncbi:YgaP family membrane protein [Antarctobacter jejuensis]|uniref:YgaP family membrane protein n=1 Tax=Antarctobacter jejuensis TaxID=1439938 RepID=UPI003FD10B24